MNTTNDFIGTLINNRERIIDKLLQNYSYAHLRKIFDEINLEQDESIKIIPNDRHLYRMLSGKFEGSCYDKSCIDWIPSEELVDAILEVATKFNIAHIEEIYSGMGILSALLMAKQNKITITTSDTFDNINTCNKLDLVPIAKRGANDFIYYEKIGEPYPQMIISSFYPLILATPNTNKNFYDSKMEEIIKLIQRNNHDIIMLFLPHAYTNLYSIFYHIVMDSEYMMYTYHIKALDKYFYLTNLMNKHYPSSMLAHIFIKKNILNADKAMYSIFNNAIMPSRMIDTQCTLARSLTYLYDKLSTKLIKRIYRSYDMFKPIYQNKNLKEIIQYFMTFEQMKIINIPQYIYDIEEFLFWGKCVSSSMYFHFENRLEFYDFFIRITNMELSDINSTSRPRWARTFTNTCKYLYLEIVDKTTAGWKTNQRIFEQTFRALNEENIKFFQKSV